MMHHQHTYFIHHQSVPVARPLTSPYFTTSLHLVTFQLPLRHPATLFTVKHLVHCTYLSSFAAPHNCGFRSLHHNYPRYISIIFLYLGVALYTVTVNLHLSLSSCRPYVLSGIRGNVWPVWTLPGRCRMIIDSLMNVNAKCVSSEDQDYVLLASIRE